MTLVIGFILKLVT